MTDVPVYMIANLTVNDAGTYRNYEKGLFLLLKKYGGQLVTFDDESEHMEGISPRSGRMIILRFPSEEKAVPGMQTRITRNCPSTGGPARPWSS